VTASLWDVVFGACALLLIGEGLLPFLSPSSWRSVFERALQMTDGQIRFLGLVCLLIGALLLLVVVG
jgi:uncharacterized protein YjeT (DUF2065 family)